MADWADLVWTDGWRGMLARAALTFAATALIMMRHP